MSAGKSSGQLIPRAIYFGVVLPICLALLPVIIGRPDVLAKQANGQALLAVSSFVYWVERSLSKVENGAVEWPRECRVFCRARI